MQTSTTSETIEIFPSTTTYDDGSPPDPVVITLVLLFLLSIAMTLAICMYTNREDIKAANMRAQSNKFKLVAHRGGPKMNFPENTLLSINNAWQSDAKGVEIDLMVTKDDKLVVFHDDSLKRMTNGEYDENVNDMDWDKLRDILVYDQNYDPNNNNNKKKKNKNISNSIVSDHIPLLSDVLDTIPFDGKVYIEVKGGDYDNKVNTQRILPLLSRTLTESGIETTKVCITSFDHSFINECKATLPQFNAYYVASFGENDGNFVYVRTIPDLESLIQQACDNNINGIIHEYNTAVIDDVFASKMQKAHLSFGVWCDPEDDNIVSIHKMKNMGAAFFITDGRLGYKIA